MSHGHFTKISRDVELLSEPSTEVNGNDPSCKRMENYKERKLK